MTLPTRTALINRYGTQEVAARWDRWASCKGMETDTFHPFIRQGRKGAHYEDPTLAPKAICAACPVREECLGYAIDHDITDAHTGIWGGTTPAERRQLRLAQRRATLTPEQLRAQATLAAIETRGHTARSPIDQGRRDKRQPQEWCTKDDRSYRAGCNCRDCKYGHARSGEETRKRQAARFPVDPERVKRRQPQEWCKANGSSYRRGCRCWDCVASTRRYKGRPYRARKSDEGAA